MREANRRTWPLRAPGILAASMILVGSIGCTPLDDAMVAIFGRSMRDQASFDPYEDPLPAPEGSVPFSAGNLPAGPDVVNLGQPGGLEDVPPPFTQLDLVNEAEVIVDLPNPVDATEASVARGEELFVRFCAPCHGPDGSGATGYIIEAGYPPFPLNTDRVKGFTDGYIYGMIRVGRGIMPAYGHRISHFDRWSVVNYLRVLQGVVPDPGGGGDGTAPEGAAQAAGEGVSSGAEAGSGGPGDAPGSPGTGSRRSGADPNRGR